MQIPTDLASPRTQCDSGYMQANRKMLRTRLNPTLFT
uniref:Uncharacterized protein n=1 Tax=Arundo donax TaxID=35708 RepID=A0A0A8ZVN4_ARUDO